MNADKTSNIEYETGLVLSGGAYRGIGQIGVLKALEERGIRPDIISGTSSGALNAVLYASGYSPDEMYEIWEKEPMAKTFNLHFPQFGMLKHGKIGELVKPYLRHQRLEELPIPLRLTASCLNDGSQKIFSEGTLVKVLEACCAVPLAFEPVEIDGRMYVDGGLVSNLPTEPLEGKCRRLIGVSVNPVPFKERLDGMTDTIYRTIWIGIESTVQKTRKVCDWLIAPEEFGQHGFMERTALPVFFNAGYEYTLRFLDEQGYRGS
ncbi:patatin-like phospholipase family protein [Cesiribacter sp. SM1]|uniref:patatin-like phospholipase family protein n=1 Tax=Cesiribacter sp. SM1 TaxID=2861196 RepID=UPI0027155B9B|nr:patatin-like phospholipase family protein [Cesiribacter sp. SM1]